MPAASPELNYGDVYESSSSSPKYLVISPRKKQSRSSSKHSPQNFSFEDVYDETTKDQESLLLHDENPLHNTTDRSQSLHSKIFNSVKVPTSRPARSSSNKANRIEKNRTKIEHLETKIKDECVTLRRYNALLEKRGIHGIQPPEMPIYTGLTEDQILEKQFNHILNLNTYLRKCSNKMNKINVNEMVGKAVTEAKRKRSGGKSRRRRGTRRHHRRAGCK